MWISNLFWIFLGILLDIKRGYVTSQMTLLQKLTAFQRGRHSRPEGQRVWCSGCASQHASVHVPCKTMETHMMTILPPHCGPAPCHSVLLSCFQATGKRRREWLTWSSILSRLQYQVLLSNPTEPWRRVNAARGLSPNYMKANIQENKPDVQIKVLYLPFPVSVSRK